MSVTEAPGASGAEIRIGELARESGASVRALRYYEEQGLLTAERSPSGQRHYARSAVVRVRLIRSLYAAGLNSATIATLLPCVDAPSVAVTREAVELMRHERERIEEQIAALVATRGHLDEVITAATAYAGELV